MDSDNFELRYTFTMASSASSSRTTMMTTTTMVFSRHYHCHFNERRILFSRHSTGCSQLIFYSILDSSRARLLLSHPCERNVRMNNKMIHTHLRNLWMCDGKMSRANERVSHRRPIDIAVAINHSDLTHLTYFAYMRYTEINYVCTRFAYTRSFIDSGRTHMHSCGTSCLPSPPLSHHHNRSRWNSRASAPYLYSP